VQGPVVFVALAAPAEPLGVILKLGLHDPAYGHDVAADTRVDHIIPNLTVDGLRELPRVDVFHVIFYLLDTDALEEGSLGGVFLRVENTRATVDIDTFVRLLPLAVNEMHVNLGFTLVTLELDGFDQDFNGAYTQNSASQTDEFVD